MRTISLLVIFVIFQGTCLGIPQGTEPERVPENLRVPVSDPRNRRIIGGTPAEIQDFPHTLALYDATRDGFICGASVIGPRWALSAAHCLEFQVPANRISLRGGATKHSEGLTFFAESYTLHPRYDSDLKEYDAALIRTTENSVLTGPNIVTIPLPKACSSQCCQTCLPQTVTKAGWGRDGRGLLPPNLFTISLPMVDKAMCSDVWKGLGDMFFCVHSEPGRDSCSGDSGSAVIRKVDDKWMQIGVVSFGTKYCDGSRPSVHTRIEMPEIRDWIHSLTGI